MTTPFRLGPDQCCCPEGCWIFSDAFYRADSTNLGSNWNELIGDWGILNNELVEDYFTGTSGTANATLICTQQVPARSSGSMYIEIDVPIVTLTIGDVYRIYPACTTTSATGPVTCTFTYLGLNVWQIVVSPSSGDESTSESEFGGGVDTIHHTLHVCSDRVVKDSVVVWGMVRAGVKPAVNELSSWADTDPGNGQYAGIGHNNIGKLNVFDNFDMGELRTVNDLCHECFCMCSATPPIPTPPVLTGQFLYTDQDPTRIRAKCLEGRNWEMRYSSDPTIVLWLGTWPLSDTGTATDSFGVESIDFELRCNGQGVFQLVVNDPCLICNVANVTSGLHPSTCDPLAIVFGPFTLGFAQSCALCYGINAPSGCIIPPDDEPECNGDFWIVFTE